MCTCSGVVCSGGAELQIDDIIDPAEELASVFLCSVTGSDLQWTVGDVGFSFILVDDVEEVRRNSLQPGSFARLLEVTPINSTVARRISILRYVPQPNFTGPINVTCQAQGFAICTATTFVGKSSISGFPNDTCMGSTVGAKSKFPGSCWCYRCCMVGCT
jgi:hypothetical protein